MSGKRFLRHSAVVYKQLLVLCALFFILSAVTVQAGDNLYLNFGLAGGGVIAPDSELKSSPPAGDADFDGGFSIKASLGLLLAERLQLEGEYLFTRNRIDSVINPPTVTDLMDSDRTTHSLMLNATYRIEVPPQGDTFWTRRGYYVYFGGGAGISWQNYTLETLVSDTDSSLAWQVMVGFEKMHPSPNLFSAFPSPFLQYRFLQITDGNFGAFKADASLHLVEFGFRFYGGFGS